MARFTQSRWLRRFVLRKMSCASWPFVALAAALSIFTMYVGITGLVMFAVLPGNERLYAVLGLCSVCGSITLRIAHAIVLAWKIPLAAHPGHWRFSASSRYGLALLRSLLSEFLGGLVACRGVVVRAFR